MITDDGMVHSDEQTTLTLITLRLADAEEARARKATAARPGAILGVGTIRAQSKQLVTV